MGNLFTSNQQSRSRYKSNISMRSLSDPLIDSSFEALSNQLNNQKNQIDRLQVELGHGRLENQNLKSDLQKMQTNYGREIYGLGESYSSVSNDIDTLMKNQEIIQELLQKILEGKEKDGKIDASVYASVHSLTNSFTNSESRL